MPGIISGFFLKIRRAISIQGLYKSDLEEDSLYSNVQQIAVLICGRINDVAYITRSRSEVLRCWDSGPKYIIHLYFQPLDL